MEEVKRHFEAEAQDFDGIILALILDYGQMLDALVAGLPFEKTKPIRAVDLGCGTGTVARAKGLATKEPGAPRRKPAGHPASGQAHR